METPDLKHCPICAQDLPVSEFGICRARKDGRNLYCRSCIRAKVTEWRKNLKEYKSAKKRRIELQIEGVELTPPATGLIRLSPVDRVRKAIQNGHNTQRKIEIETKLGKDVIGDCIASLLLWTNEIRTKLIGDTRLYYPKPVQIETAQSIKTYSSSLVEIARKHCGPVVRGTKEIRRIA